MLKTNPHNIAAKQIDYDALMDRLGEQLFKRRKERQESQWARKIHQGEGIFRMEKYVSPDLLIQFMLKATGAWKTAHQNMFEIETNIITWQLSRLPDSFNNYKILQLSDLHIDIHPDLSKYIAQKVSATEHDLMVITGDFKNSPEPDYQQSMRQMQKVLERSMAPKIGILGNHDFMEMVSDLESFGLRILLNESTRLTKNEESIWIAGVDDPHFFKTHDFSQARKCVPADAFCLLLCHSPEFHMEATEHDFDLMLSGHTHGGQICLPNGRHVVCPVKGIGSEFIKGCWSSGGMKGYTSKGTGASGVAARLNCAPEITLHVLTNS